jgi:2-dehydro-3-deoxygalactonokinase
VSTRILAADWGSSRLRAWLLAADGAVLGHVASARGAAGLSGHDAFSAALRESCGDWLDDPATSRLIVAGMAGGRNAWHEAAYLRCPLPLDTLRPGATPHRIGHLAVEIIPGICCDWPDGTFEVIRGEETLALGAATDGMVCLPGTHSKWVEMSGGAVTRFATFLTGELHAMCLAHGIVGRLAAPDQVADAAAFARGLDASGGEGGIANTIFRARTERLAGRLAPASVGAFLSGVLIGAEVAGAAARLGATAGGFRSPTAAPAFGVTDVTLVAPPPLAALYETALARAGVAVRQVAAEDAFLSGVRRMLGA